MNDVYKSPINEGFNELQQEIQNAAHIWDTSIIAIVLDKHDEVADVRRAVEVKLTVRQFPTFSVYVRSKQNAVEALGSVNVNHPQVNFDPLIVLEVIDGERLVGAVNSYVKVLNLRRLNP